MQRALGLALLLVVGLPGPASPQAEGKVTGNFRDEPLEAVLAAVAELGGVKVRFAADVPQEARRVRVTLSVRDVGARAVVRLLLRQAGLVFPGLAVSGPADDMVIRVQPPEEEGGEFLVTPALKDGRLAGKLERRPAAGPLRTVLAAIVAGSGVEVRVLDGVPDMRVSVPEGEITRMEALLAVITAAQAEIPELEAVREAAVYRLRLRVRKPASPEVQRVLAERRVTVAVQEVSFRRAVDEILRGSGLQYTFHPNLLTPVLKPVTLDLKEVPLEAALRNAVTAAGRQGLGFWLDGDILVFAVRGPAGVPPAPRGAP